MTKKKREELPMIVWETMPSQWQQGGRSGCRAKEGGEKMQTVSSNQYFVARLCIVKGISVHYS